MKRCILQKAIKDIILNAGDKVDENAIREQATKMECGHYAGLEWSV